MQISQLRNLSTQKIHFCPHINVVTGMNGSGKSSLLEALYLLGSGRSFRTHKPRLLIRENEAFCSVYASLSPDETNNETPEDVARAQANLSTATALITKPRSVGLQKNSDGTQYVKIDGQDQARLSTLAQLFPVQLIASDLELLTDASPQNRRQFIDWGVFHVEPGYAALWRDANHLLKRRNALLRTKVSSYRFIEPWDQQWNTICEKIDQLRAMYIQKLSELLDVTEMTFAKMGRISLTYERGWPETASFLDLLKTNFDRDRDHGYTQWGPHKSDLRIRLQLSESGKAKDAQDALSRGQKKILCASLALAQAQLLKKQTHKSSLFLIDDWAAELDAPHQHALCKQLHALGFQIVMTAIEQDTLRDALSGMDYKTFHAEQGTIRALSTDEHRNQLNKTHIRQTRIITHPSTPTIEQSIDQEESYE